MKWEVQEVSPELSVKLRNMSFICALMVVCIHCYASANPKHDVFWLVQLTTFSLCGVAVPFFFMVSGYLLAGKMGQASWWRCEVAKRVRSLLIPFFIASAIYLVLTIPIDAIKDLRHGDVLRNNPFANGNILRTFGLDFCTSPILDPLWFVRALFVLMAMSPVVKWLVAATRGWVVPMFFVVYYFICPQIDGEPLRLTVGNLYGFFKYGFSLEGLSYFSLGVAIRRWNWRMDFGRTASVCLAVAGFAISVYKTILLYNGTQPFVHWSVLAIPCYLFAIFHFVPSKPYPAVLTTNAFAIFLVHYFPNFIYLRCVSKIAKHWHSMFLNFVFVVPVSILICQVLRRKLPRFSKMLFGGR